MYIKNFKGATIMNTPQTKIADFNLVNTVLNSDVSGGEI